MVFNPQKCEFLRITNKKHPILNQYKIQTKNIKEVSHAKYLGVTISHNLTWSEHINPSRLAEPKDFCNEICITVHLKLKVIVTKRW